MKTDNDNLESDPHKSQDLGLDFTNRKTANGFKNGIHRYSKIFTERKETLCK